MAPGQARPRRAVLRYWKAALGWIRERVSCSRPGRQQRLADDLLGGDLLEADRRIEVPRREHRTRLGTPPARPPSHPRAVCPTLASRVRLLGSGRSDKNDPDDALSVAVAALRSPTLRPVQAVDHGEVLRLLAKRNLDLGSHRTRVVCRLHAALASLTPGGMAKKLNVSAAQAFLDEVQPASPVEHVRLELARELLADIGRLDLQLKDSHARIRVPSSRRARR